MSARFVFVSVSVASHLTVPESFHSTSTHTSFLDVGGSEVASHLGTLVHKERKSAGDVQQEHDNGEASDLGARTTFIDVFKKPQVANDLVVGTRQKMKIIKRGVNLVLRKMGGKARNGTSPNNLTGETEDGALGQGSQKDRGFESELRKPILDTSDMSLEELDEQWENHHDRFRCLGELDDIRKAIEYATRALNSTPEGAQDVASRNSNLAISYGDRFERLGKLDDVERAIEHGSRALELTPQEHPEDLVTRRGNLATFYRSRFQRLGELGDLDKAIGHDARALELTPDGQPQLSDRYTNLGVSYGNRFRRLGDMHDLGKAIEYHSRALELAPDGDPYLSYRHTNLGASYTDRFQRLGDVHDLERAIEHESRVLELTPDGHPDLADGHAGLGVSYTYRFGRLGELNDLEKAIEHETRALELTPHDHPSLPRRHANLGVSYTVRFQCLGEIHDLEKAIEHDSCALELTPGGHPDLSGRHASLGASYLDRFRSSGELNDLEKAIEHHSRALELTPDGHPHLSVRLADLGVSRTDRFRHLGEINDLERAIKHFSRALELTPGDHPYLSLRNANLGASYADRFQRLGEIHDLEKVVEHHSRALELTPEGHPDLLDRYLNQAQTLILQYRHTNHHAHLQSSLDFFHKASRLSIGLPRKAFQNALEWAKRATQHSPLNSVEAYHTTIDLLPQFIWLGATTSQRYHDLSTVENLAINAANAAILHSDPKVALEWLEHARCVVWNQTLMLRSPLDQLQSAHPDLAVRLQTVSEQLHESGSESSAIHALSIDSMNFEQIGQNRRRLAREYNALLTRTRTLPGFEDFLRPMKVNQLVHAARYGPIVVINCHEDRCDALVILPGQDDVQHLPLPNFTAKDAHSARSDLEFSLQSKGLRERGVKMFPQPGQKDKMESVLLSLWMYIVKPILDFLEITKDALDNLPHITWCPTGELSFLPLHAAGDYNQPQSRVFDYAVSSYTRTLTSLLASASDSLTPTPRLLAIGQTNTPGHTYLPGTATELAYVKAQTQNTAEYTQIIGDQATVTTVLDEMEKHDWVHLACHAHQNVEDPTSSGFYLHDGTLDLESINRRAFSCKGLAFLSACQTATGDEKLPDEAVHLASGMLMAGYRSVIATMWSVNDEDAPLVADKVYAQLMKDGKIGNGEAGRALHYAIAELRDKVGEKTFGRWVPYIHIGS